MNNCAAILVGGKGRRLGDLTKKIPKPLIKVNNKEFLKYLLYHVATYNFRKIYLISKYKSNLFFKIFHKKFYFNSQIICLKENEAKDTGGALFELKKKINCDFFLFNGDSIFSLSTLDINKLKKTNKIVNIALTKKNNYLSNNKLTSLKIKNKNICFAKNGQYMNSGVYFFKKKIFNFILKKKISLERDLLPTLINNKKVQGIYFKKEFIDIGTKIKLKYIQNNISKYLSFKCVFLDRDGVINKDFGYVHSINKFKILPGVLKAIKYLKTKKYLVIIITNQSGIGRGYYNVKQLFKLHKFLNNKLKKKKTIIDDIYYCPHHPNKLCECRKPKTMLIENAIKEWAICKSKSFMIGDKITDKICAERSKIKFFFKKKNSLYQQIRKII
jgi:D-glycero-D-manno-heptose 1,7-bisphosphate phosphatase